MQATKHEIRKNVESLLSVPVSLVDERVLAEYIRRARQGDDVYAYTAKDRTMHSGTFGTARRWTRRQATVAFASSWGSNMDDELTCPTCGDYGPGCDCDGYFSREMEAAYARMEGRKPRICPVCKFPDARCHCWEEQQ
jgi:hypothetical protein